MTTEQLKPHTAEQVLTWANDLRRDGGQALVVEMLESYAALLKVKTGQPSLSDAEITDEQICEVLLLVGVSPYGYPKSGDRFIRNDTKRIITAFRALLAQRQDSNKDAERYRKAIAYEDNAGLLYCAVMNHCPDKAAIDAEFDAEAIDIAIANGAPK